MAFQGTRDFAIKGLGAVVSLPSGFLLPGLQPIESGLLCESQVCFAAFDSEP